jgi:uncharacterized protein YgiM (DUF1202 family)
MKNIKLLFLIVIVFCQTTFSQVDSEVDEIITTVQQKYVPDGRLGVFKIEPEMVDGKLTLNGETDNQVALDELLSELRANKIAFENSILILPDTALRGAHYAVVIVSVGNMRSKNGHDNEMVSQVLLGTELKVLKKRGGFYYVQTPDKYLGWIESGSIKLYTGASISEWRDSQKLIYTDLFGIIYSKEETSSEPILDIVVGAVVKFVAKEGTWYKVENPDGRIGYISEDKLEDKDSWEKSRELSFYNLFETAKRFMGFPYLWGGTSSKGLDCSGFVKTIFFLNGMTLPRDASQQALVGEKIIPEKDYKNVNKGDLLFFGSTDKNGKQRVTHVAMYIGDLNFIHCASFVQIESLDPNSPIYDKYHSERLLKITRHIK